MRNWISNTQLFILFIILSSLTACGGGSDNKAPTQVADTIAPVITLNGDLSVNLTVGDTYTELGATATDNKDGNVNVTIQGAVDTNAAGTYTITYSATDAAGNASQITRTVIVSEPPARAFITTWDTRKEGVSEDNQIKIDTEGSGFNYSIDWGDGNVDNNVQGDITHTYDTAGEYTIKITGDFPHFYMGDVDVHIQSGPMEPTIITKTFVSDNDKLLSVQQWGSIKWTSMSSMFNTTAEVEYAATDIPDLSAVTDLSKMFSSSKGTPHNLGDWDTSNVTNMSYLFHSTKLNGDIAHWNVSNVTDMSYMFASNSTFNHNIGDWNVSKVTNMSHMFYRAGKFNQDISNWAVANVVNMSNMFELATDFNQLIDRWNVASVTNMNSMFKKAFNFNQALNSWDVSKVVNMGGMFNGAVDFNQDITDWNVSSVADMSGMFSGAHSFNQAIGNWNVSSVTNMSGMFSGTREFNQDIGDWNVGKVTDMSGMFRWADKFNQDIGKWDLGRATKLNGMFEQAVSFNQDISGWNVANVEDMSRMFYKATAFDQDLSKWQITGVKYVEEQVFDETLGQYLTIDRSMNFMFYDVTLSTANYDALLISWSGQNINSNIKFNAGKSQLSGAAAAAKQRLIDEFNWTIVDGGQQ